MEAQLETDLIVGGREKWLAAHCAENDGLKEPGLIGTSQVHHPRKSSCTTDSQSSANVAKTLSYNDWHADTGQQCSRHAMQSLAGREMGKFQEIQRRSRK
jgi:hypothetical protein